VAALQLKASALSSQGHPVVLLAPPDLRRPLFDFASRFVADLSVIAARELVPGTNVEPGGTVSL
jgi:flagellar biosynthesis protein FlhA